MDVDVAIIGAGRARLDALRQAKAAGKSFVLMVAKNSERWARETRDKSVDGMQRDTRELA